jgi:hypothetical protein
MLCGWALHAVLPLQSPKTHWSTDNIALNDNSYVRQHGDINRQQGDRDRRNCGLSQPLAGHPLLRRDQGRRRQQTRAPASLGSAAAMVSTAYRRRAQSRPRPQTRDVAIVGDEEGCMVIKYVQMQVLEIIPRIF